MLTKFLDLRTTQNASYANSISVPISVVSTPQFVGQLGLDTTGASGVIRVTFSGTVALQLPLLPVASTITLTVTRGTTSVPNQGVVYSVSEVLEVNILGSTTLSFTGTDFNVPAPPAGENLVYSLFITTTALGVTRVGPESFTGTAVSD